MHGVQVWEIRRLHSIASLARARVNVAPGVDTPAIGLVGTSWISLRVPSPAGGAHCGWVGHIIVIWVISLIGRVQVREGNAWAIRVGNCWSRLVCQATTSQLLPDAFAIFEGAARSSGTCGFIGIARARTVGGIIRGASEVICADSTSGIGVV